eukprot:TRINITY_DN1318_c0_g1_i15.p1 TRINITY_DN1318_c0_g1~~TRINITY_DN1318_c0_g1_i15.p1  ORF type:complete len:645 (-),score=148.98 TRINITY_DN1318_c0_g1_i15:320-2254(-)
MTTVTDVIIFGYGALSVSYSSRVMSLFLVFAVSIDFALQLTFLAGVFIIDMRLANEGKWCFGLCCPGIKRCKPSYDESEEKIEMGSVKSRRYTSDNDSDSDSEIPSFRSRDNSGDLGSGVQTHASGEDTSFKGRMRRASAVDEDDDGKLDAKVGKLGKLSRLSGQRGSVTSMGSVKFDVKSVTTSTGTSSARSSMDRSSVVWSEVGLAKVKVDPSVSGRFFGDVYSRIVLKRWFHVFAGLVLLGMIGLTVYGLLTFQARAVISRDLSTNRDLPMVRHRLRALLYFPELATDQLMVWKGTDYTNATVQEALLKACDVAKGLPSTLLAKGWESSVRCWFTDFRDHLVANNMTSALRSPPDFNKQLKAFLTMPEHRELRFDIMWDRAGEEIYTSRISWKAPMVIDVETGVHLASIFEKAVVDADLNGVVAPSSQYQDYALSTRYLQNLLVETGIIAGGIATLSSAIFLINPFSSLLVSASMLFTSVCTFTLLDIHPGVVLSLQMMFVGAFAIGFGVDYTAHVVLAFNTAGGSIEQRLQTAFASIGSSVFHGVASAATIGCIIPFLEGYMQVLITIFFTAVSFSFTFAMVVVPVLVQYLKPPPALRDLDMQSRLVKRRKPLEVTWELAFARQKQDMMDERRKKKEETK